MAFPDWYRLDNVGKFYASQAGSSNQTVFRLAATMTEDVNPAALQRALAATVTRFPGFNVCLRSGLFWHYLEPAKTMPEAQPETLPICYGLHTGPASVLFRVTYFARRINVEVSHMISDGRGSLEFLKALVAAYVRERYGAAATGIEELAGMAGAANVAREGETTAGGEGKAGANSTRTAATLPESEATRPATEAAPEACATASPETEAGRAAAADAARIAQTEDSFSANYDRTAAGATAQPRIFRLPGWKRDEDFTYLELHYSAGAVHAQAKAAGATVTSWLIAAVIAAIRAEMPASERDRAIHMDVPVDLRSLFGSTTLRNFFGLAFVTYTPGEIDEPLAAIARKVQRQLTDGTEPAALKRRMMQMVKLEKNPLVRLAPLLLKDAVLELAARKTAREVTCTVSSLGRVTMGEETAPYVEGVSALTSPAGLNFIIATYGDDLSIGVSSRLVSLRVVRNLVRLLAAEGVEGYANVGKDAAAIDRDVREAQLEERLAEVGTSWRSEAGAAPRRDQGRMGRRERKTARPEVRP